MSFEIKTTLDTKPRVLLVEDDAVIQLIHRAKLEKLGCIVNLAINGKEALEKSKSKHDLILLDWGLPDIDGVEVCRQIRQYEQANQLPRAPIVMITAYAKTSEATQECTDAGIDLIIVKPIIEDQMWHQLIHHRCTSIDE